MLMLELLRWVEQLTEEGVEVEPLEMKSPVRLPARLVAQRVVGAG